MLFDIKSFSTEIKCEADVTDTKAETELNGNELKISVQAQNDKPKFIKLFWKFESDENILVLGDVWERSYGDLEFKKLKENDRYMPWYFIATDGEKNYCFGVKTGCNSFVSFRYTTEGITALIDCRNGGNGVELGGRKVELATFTYKEYDSADSFACLCDYCKTLCDNPILPKERIYGGNNWYYAYGKSSYKQIISDTEIQVELAKNCGSNKPFEVIDDCWQINRCDGPWLPNKKFGDMKKLADEIKSLGARPGIWVRLLSNSGKEITDDMKILRDGKREYLDPTHPKTQKLITDDITRIKSWGFELLKHDFSTVDMFGHYGKDLTAAITNYDNWNFCDRTKTNAEIVLDFYRLIRKCCGDMLIIGCNTVSHLCAGLVEINRTGDDTSGREFGPTRFNGVNTLAFRLAQNNAFYLVDADCVGILGHRIKWSLNKQWLDVLAKSNTALFISCNNKISKEKVRDITEAYTAFQKPHEIRPLNIFDTKTPDEWLIDGETVKYNWE